MDVGTLTFIAVSVAGGFLAASTRRVVLRRWGILRDSWVLAFLLGTALTVALLMAAFVVSFDAGWLEP